MSAHDALGRVVELTQSPQRASLLKAQDLPHDIIIPIRIAGGCGETCWQAVQTTRLPPEAIRDASRTYLQLVLFAEDSDCFRVLGVQPGASTEHMRDHMRWLLRWLHPDRNEGEWESVYADRVIHAWREARATAPRGDTARPPRLSPPAGASAGRPGRSRRLRAPVRWIPVPVERKRGAGARAIGIGTAIVMLAVAALFAPQFEPFAAWLGASETPAASGDE